MADQREMIVRLDNAVKAEIVERCQRLGISQAEAFRKGALAYLRTLELAALPSPRPGRPRKETTAAA